MHGKLQPQAILWRADTRTQLTQRLPLVAAILLFLNSVLRGIRSPDRFACQQLLFNYNFGFSKRALLGTLFEVLHVPSFCHYNFCFWFSLLFLVTNTILLIELVTRLFATKQEAHKRVALVYSSSLGVVFLAHTIGYLDHIGLLITLLALRTQGFYARATLVAALFPVSILIHETGFLTLFPVICFRFLPDIINNNDHRKIVTFCTILLGISILVLSIGSVHLSNAAATAMYHSLQEKADYPLRRDVFITPTLTSYDNLNLTISLWESSWFRRIFLLSTVVTLPTTLYLVRRSVLTLSNGGYGTWIRFGAIAASLSPLSLNALGGDLPRWATLATTTSFLVVTITMLNFKWTLRATIEPPGSHLGLPAILIAINLGASIPLFNGYIIENFPYERHIDNLEQILSGAAPFPPRPESCDESGCASIVRYTCVKVAVAADSLAADKQPLPTCDTPLDLDRQPWTRRLREFMKTP